MGIKKGEKMDNKLDKERVKDAIYKATKYEPNQVEIVTRFLKELGLE